MSHYDQTKPLNGGWKRMMNNFTISGRNVLSARQLKDRLILHQGSVTLVDIRSRSSFDAYHIPGAHCIPPDGWKRLRTDSFDPQRPIVVICQKGIMSREAVRILRNRGYKQVAALRGGMDRWQEVMSYA